METERTKEELKCVSLESGELYVIEAGESMMPLSYADNLD